MHCCNADYPTCMETLLLHIWKWQSSIKPKHMWSLECKCLTQLSQSPDLMTLVTRDWKYEFNNISHSLFICSVLIWSLCVCIVFLVQRAPCAITNVCVLWVFRCLYKCRCSDAALNQAVFTVPLSTMPNKLSKYSLSLCVCVRERERGFVCELWGEKLMCETCPSNRTGSWGQRRLMVSWVVLQHSVSLLHSVSFSVALTVNVCFHQSCVKRLWSLTRIKTATSATKTWGSAWGPWDTCPQRWSWSSSASRSVSGTAAQSMSHNRIE